MDEKILTLHPDGKKGVKILKRRYNIISNFIIDTISERKEISFSELSKIASKELKNNFDGKITWYIVTVKLDLEARKVIERIPNTSPHKLRLIN